MSGAGQMPPAAALARALDVTVAAVALVALLPLIAVVAALIVLESGRPVLFRQTRIGRDGRHFEMLKFRKFGPDVGSDGSPLTLVDDARMTRVGRVLAATKLDELPQLLNVLRGEMSVVGPRPESLAFEDCFRGRAAQLLAFRPGIFGPTQVRFRHENRYYPTDTDPARFYKRALFPAKAALDLDYYPRRTLVSDVAWIVRGVLAVLGVGGRPVADDAINWRAAADAFGPAPLLQATQDGGGA
jgi:lipopolysaccharide/colanic/teichoic acid biosynthesis glycosyltransferase